MAEVHQGGGEGRICALLLKRAFGTKVMLMSTPSGCQYDLHKLGTHVE